MGIELLCDIVRVSDTPNMKDISRELVDNLYNVAKPDSEVPSILTQVPETPKKAEEEPEDKTLKTQR